MRLAFFAALVLGCSAAPKSSGVPDPPARRDDGGVDVTVPTADGVKLAATHWVGPVTRDRCVVLVHQLGSTREEWTPLIAKLRGDYEILSFDLRGHGGSLRGPHGEITYRDFNSAEWAAAVHDVEAATAWLGERGYRTADCVYVGSSIGSSLVVRHAGAHPEAGGLVLLSPGLGYKGLSISEAAGSYGGPVLVVFSGEEGMETVVAQLDAIWGGRAQLLETEGTLHGVAMISDDEAQLDLVVSFIAAAFEGGE